MKHLAIYIEGGGNTTDQKAALRRGFEGLLKDIRARAREKKLGPRIVMCGSREETFAAFKNACNTKADATNILLVDAEAPVCDSPAKHLHGQDGWTLDFVAEDRVHLMVQVMEIWLLADRDALKEYYGPGFHEGSLPKARDLETVGKTEVQQGLKRATANTTKGEYHKIWHASDLLAKVDVQKVRDQCKHCNRLFVSVEGIIESR
jgi:hypothetical protein